MKHSLHLLKALGVAALFSATACGPTSAPEVETCPDENRVLLGGHKYCVIDQTIIEKGFDCPADLSYRHEVPGANGAVCSDLPVLPKQDIEPLKELVTDPPGTGSWLNNPEPDPDPMPGLCQGPDPSEQECDVDADCSNGQVCGVSAAQVCVPSVCGCDPMTGAWSCTADCGQGRACVDPEPSCTDPNPAEAGCRTDAECGDGETCQTSAQQTCVPSGCSCEGGGWTCTEDCGELKECAPAENSACAEPDPSLQRECNIDDDCDGEEICQISADTVCVPSSCGCDPFTGSWQCTADCQAPSACVPRPDPEPCSDGTQIVCDAVAGPCPTGLIRETVGGCFGECVDPVTCESPVELCSGSPDPSYQECDVDADCEGNAICQSSDLAVCIPSGCACSPMSGTWTCTDDCNASRSCVDPGNSTRCGDGSMLMCRQAEPSCPAGQIAEIINGCYGECVDATTCEAPAEMCGGSPDPSLQHECSVDADCGDNGATCQISPAAVCVPSSCFCDEMTGAWACTEDCLPSSSCVP